MELSMLTKGLKYLFRIPLFSCIGIIVREKGFKELGNLIGTQILRPMLHEILSSF